jgi:CspA family cold shock protein
MRGVASSSCYKGNSHTDWPPSILDEARRFGFITNEAGGADAFVHISAVHAAGMKTLEKEQPVSYELENDAARKSSASKLKAV